MGQPSYSIEEVYKEIVAINGYFTENDNGQLTVNNAHKLIDDYCHSWCVSENGECHDYFQLASCSVFYLLNNLKDKFDSKYDKLAEYAILWLSYKLNQNKKYSTIELNDFYTNYIEKNDNYNNKINDDDDNMTYKEIINKNNDLMDNNEISKFNGPFSILCILYNEINKTNWNCNKCSKDANEFVQKYKELNENSNINGNPSYSKLLSTLSNDYDNLKKKCTDFPPLTELTPKKSSTQNPVVNTVDSPGKGAEKVLGDTPEVTSSSSSILNTVIPGLSIFAIPVFLGVAYKVNNNELKTIIFKLYFCDPLYAFIKKYIIIFPFLY
ncbi:CIR protein PIR protein [Plasmodium vinckei vinckei]|uniref:CIR protein PIR protein n=1 Tax=Plasmodium vinckei vinckei TaxID=54757 RepID=A0A449BNS5_PLAVN|nr:CIR protein PIR protein [Plasmodium vinckei vinckei]VEV55111.1 CIR protein PIR protein [Plasmodium vinckei vinckei]